MGREKIRRKDSFAEIAAKKQVLRENDLVTPQPPELEKVYLSASTNNPKAAFKPLSGMNTVAELKRELEKYRRKFDKFTRNLAPKVENKRKKLHLKTFDWRIQDSGDPQDFGRVLAGRGIWEKVDIPHYGGVPLQNSICVITPFLPELCH